MATPIRSGPVDPYGRGTPVALQDVARLVPSSAPAQIKRRDRRRYHMVSCQLAGRALSDVKDDAQRIIDGMDLPAGVDTTFLGEVEMAEDALGSLLLALGLAIIFVYAVLASQFESFIHPISIEH